MHDTSPIRGHKLTPLLSSLVTPPPPPAFAPSRVLYDCRYRVLLIIIPLLFTASGIARVDLLASHSYLRLELPTRRADQIDQIFIDEIDHTRYSIRSDPQFTIKIFQGGYIPNLYRVI